MKLNIILGGGVGVLIHCAAIAGLQVGYNDLGKTCYSEDDERSGVRLIACGPSAMYTQDINANYMYKCPDRWDDYQYETMQPMHTTTCYLGVRDNYLYICDSIGADDPEFTCNYCGFNEISWESIGGNRVRGISQDNIEQYATSQNWKCTVNKPYDYGCAAGYYTAATVPSATMTCTACPSSGGAGGTSVVGNTAITGCFIPGGKNFAESLGAGTYTDKCFYKK